MDTQYNVPEYLKYLTIMLGIISTILGIIKWVIDFLKNKDKKLALIILLSGLLLICIGKHVLISMICDNTVIEIDSPKDYEFVESKVNIYGRAFCLPKNFKIFFLVHKNDGCEKNSANQDMWYISPTIASKGKNDTWNATDINVGTENDSGCRFEIQAVALPDSASNKLQITIKNPLYSGSIIKPLEYIEFYRTVTVTRK